MAGLTDALWLLGSYIVAFVLFYVGLEFFTKGFLTQYLKTKASRGRLVLVRCHDVTDTYYRASKIEKRNLVVKDREKNIHTFSKITIDQVGRELGVNLINVDLVKGTIIKRDFSEETSYDLTVLDEMVDRALKLPRIGSEVMWERIQKVLFIIIIVGIGVIIYLLLAQQGVAPSPVGGNI